MVISTGWSSAQDGHQHRMVISTGWSSAQDGHQHRLVVQTKNLAHEGENDRLLGFRLALL
jgi:hypothetical protein